MNFPARSRSSFDTNGLNSYPTRNPLILPTLILILEVSKGVASFIVNIIGRFVNSNKEANMIIWFLFGAMCTLVVLFLAAYWKFMQLNRAAQSAWQQLENNLKNRDELIPALALCAAAFNELDRTFVEQLYRLKETCHQSTVLKERALHEEQITQAFKQVFTAAQNHPDLTSNDSFARLRENVIKAEGKVQRSKRKYNTAARDFNTITSIIPLNLIAILFELSPYDYFDFDSSVSKPTQGNPPLPATLEK